MRNRIMKLIAFCGLALALDTCDGPSPSTTDGGGGTGGGRPQFAELSSNHGSHASRSS
jgi:hypothetical protein